MHDLLHIVHIYFFFNKNFMNSPPQIYIFKILFIVFQLKIANKSEEERIIILIFALNLKTFYVMQIDNEKTPSTSILRTQS